MTRSVRVIIEKKLGKYTSDPSNTAVTRFPPIASVTLLLTMTTQSAIPTSVIGVVLLLETVTGQDVAEAYPITKLSNAIDQLIFKYLFNLTQLV